MRELTLDSWSDLHSRLFWAYSGTMPKVDLDLNYQRWPQAGWLIQEGSVTLDDGEHTEVARAGDWVFPGNRRCRQVFSPDNRFICIRFALMWRTGGGLFPSKKSVVFAADRFPELEVSTRELLSLVELYFGDSRNSMGKVREAVLTHFEVMRAFNEWVFQYVKAMLTLGVNPRLIEESDPRVDTVLAVIRDVPLTRKLRETELARLCGLSVSQLNRLFVKLKGKTPVEIFQERRFREARNGLKKEGQNIKSLAYQIGFSSPGNFATWFRKRSGLSPSEWRKRARP